MYWLFGSGVTLGLYSFSKRVFGIFTDILSGGISSVTYPLYASLQDDKISLKNHFSKQPSFQHLSVFQLTLA
ncbi:oligosaccharide flippase family protein [Klebsiella pneumoniae]|uniref:oligosaccharide flippase family protein n=1 Tax=Klebsiella pneumoniae TaxID=573 RepID=UPI000F53542B